MLKYFNKHDVGISSVLLFTSFFKNLLMPELISFLPAGKGAQSDNKDQLPKCQFPAIENWHCPWLADYLFKGQQHQEYLRLP